MRSSYGATLVPAAKSEEDLLEPRQSVERLTMMAGDMTVWPDEA